MLPSRCLFVYGTLMTGECRHQLLQAGEIESITAASVSGVLFDLGEYPGIILSPECTVYGEFIAFKCLEAILNRLDEEEGPEYRRELLSVNLLDGRKRSAWAYLLASAPKHARLIPSGDWRAR